MMKNQLKNYYKLKMAVVYRHIRLDKNEVFYVGIGKTEARPHSVNDRNRYWKNITNKTDYRVDILFDDLTWNEACEKEIEFIELYGRKDLGKGTLVNLTNGGEGVIGQVVSDETRIKLSNSSKLMWLDDNIRNKMIKARTGNQRGRYKYADVRINTSFENSLNDIVVKESQKLALLGKGKKGYYFNKQLNKFSAKIVINGKNIYLGSYDNEIDARNVYLKYYNEYMLFLNKNNNK